MPSTSYMRINGTYILHYMPLPFGPNEALERTLSHSPYLPLL